MDEILTGNPLPNCNVSMSFAYSTVVDSVLTSTYRVTLVSPRLIRINISKRQISLPYSNNLPPEIVHSSLFHFSYNVCFSCSKLYVCMHILLLLITYYTDNHYSTVQKVTNTTKITTSSFDMN